MGIFSFLLVLFQLLLLLPSVVLGSPETSDAKPKISPTEGQMLFFGENLYTFLSGKCTVLSEGLSNLTQIPFWPIELLDKMKECIDKMSLGALVQFFDEKIQQQQEKVKAEQKKKHSFQKFLERKAKVVKMNDQFWRNLLQKLSEKVLKNGKAKKELKSLSKEEQLLIMRELFIIGEIFEKKVEQEFRANKKLQEDITADRDENFDGYYLNFDNFRVKNTVLEGIVKKYGRRISVWYANYIYRTDERCAFSAAVLLAENILQNEYKKSNFSAFDMSQYFDITANLPEHDALIEISISTDQILVFVENLNNYLSDKCTDITPSLFTTKKDPSWYLDNGLEETIQKCIGKMKIGKLVSVFDEQNEQQQVADFPLEKRNNIVDVKANEFLEKILKKMLEKLPGHKIRQNISVKQQMENLNDEQHLLILRELFIIGEHFEKQLEEDGRDKIGKDYGIIIKIDFGYNEEIKWKCMQAEFWTKYILLSDKYKRRLFWFDMKEFFLVHFAPRESTKDEHFRVEIEPSLSQIAIFVDTMGKFLHSKCGFEESTLIEKIESKNVLDQCFSELEKIESFFANESKDVKKILALLLEKILGNLHKKEKNRHQLDMNLNEEQKWMVLLKLFKLAYWLNKILYENLKKFHKELKEDDYPFLNFYDVQFYESKMKKYVAVEYVIRRKLEQEFKERYFSHYYTFEQVHMKINFEPKNIYGIKLKVKIDTFALTNIIQIIGQFINAKCDKNMWNYVDNEKKLKNCAERVNFAELGNNLSEETRKQSIYIINFVNLIVGILKTEASRGKSAKLHQLNPYDMNIYSQIDASGPEIKLSVLKGLLQFVRLFTIGILAKQDIVRDNNRIMTWNEIPITILREDHYYDKEKIADKLKSINEALIKEGKSK